MVNIKVKKKTFCVIFIENTGYMQTFQIRDVYR